jgi:hypothetical protein
MANNSYTFKRGKKNRVKSFGVLHSSGLNRKQRRTEESLLRTKAARDRAKEADDRHMARRRAIAARVLAKQSAAHARAVTRKAALKQ